MATGRRIAGFELGAGAIAIALAALCLGVAWQQWFAADDFAYLAQARGGFLHLPWTLAEVFCPSRPGFNWAYRPLSLELFFFLAHAAFGLHAFGYLAVSLACHFGAGVLVFLLARRLALRREAAIFAALLAVSRAPSLIEVNWICTFSYVLSKLWMLAAVLLALGATRRERALPRLALFLAAAGATGLALLSQELAVVTPAIVAAALLVERRPWRHLALGLALQLVVAAVWLYVRFRLIVVAPQPGIYGPILGWNVPLNALHMLGQVFASWPALALVLALWLGAGALLSRRGDAPAERGWLRVALLALVWLGACLAPFLAVLGPQLRFSIPAELPLSLLLAAAASAAWEGAPVRLRPLVPAAAALTVLATLPFQALHEQATRPRGALPRALVEFVSRLPRLSPNASVIVLHGGARLAPAEVARELEAASWHSTVFLAAFPDKRLRLVLRDVSREALDQPCGSCVYVELRPDRTLQPRSPP